MAEKTFTDIADSPIIVEENWSFGQPMQRYPHDNIIRPRRMHRVPQAVVPVVVPGDNDAEAPAQPLPVTNIDGEPPAALLAYFTTGNFAVPELAAKLAMIALEHVYNRYCMPELLMRQSPFTGIQWPSRHQAWTTNFFALLCMIYSTGNITGFTPSCWTSMAKLPPEQRQRARSFCDYLCEQYRTMGNNTYFPVSLSWNILRTKNIKGIWSTWMQSLRNHGMFSHEFLYGKHATYAMNKMWVQGLPFTMVLHLDSLCAALQPVKYNDNVMHICGDQKTRLENNRKLYATTEDQHQVQQGQGQAQQGQGQAPPDEDEEDPDDDGQAPDQNP
jgi:hypothetical protein